MIDRLAHLSLRRDKPGGVSYLALRLAHDLDTGSSANDR